MVKVSVVIPVYNPGSNIDDLVRTLLEQSLPDDEYEAIFVDDGSTDGTGERLDALAAQHEHFRVEHIPNSGWPGRPRNVGTDLAHGTYVLYADNDDYLAPRALERLYDRAERDKADVVIGKVVGHGGKRVPRALFAEDRTNVTLDWPPLVSMLTPHKLFRRSFLAEHGIRFPEGRTRLEDHHFVVEAYFHTDRISILTGRPVYHWVKRGRDNASLRMDPAVYVAGLRAVLDLIEAHTAPGEARDALLVHWLQRKVLGFMGERSLLTWRDGVRVPFHAELRRLALERLGPHLDARLPMNLRVRAAILRQGTLADLEQLATWETGLEARFDAAVRPRHAGYDLALAAQLAADGVALTFTPDGDDLVWVPPDEIRAIVPAGTDLSVTPGLDAAPELFLRHTRRKTEHLVPIDHEVHFTDGVPMVVASARLDPDTAGDGGLPIRAGRWRVGVIISMAGFEVRVHPLVARHTTPDLKPIVLEVAKRAPATDPPGQG